MTKQNFDVIIIGGGAAGLSAALWCDDLNLNALLVESEVELGGQLLRIYNRIENHLGAPPAKNGCELRDAFLRQIEKRKFTLKLSAEIVSIDLEKKIVSLKNGERFAAKAIVIAAGVRRRKLNVAGEAEFKGKGIIESGARDANLIAGKNAAIVGGGDAAFENALILSKTAARVWLIHHSENFRARVEFVEQVSANPKIEILTDTTVEKIVGGERIEAVDLRNIKTNKTSRLPIDSLLIRVGIEPNTELFRGKLDLDDKGFVKIDSLCRTNIKGVFAVGDAANPVAPTISGAIGMGATAVKTVVSSRLSVVN